MTDTRPLLRAIFNAAVAAAHPGAILSQHLPPPPRGRVILLATGKGGAALASAAEHHYLDTLKLAPARLTGLATTRHGHAVSTRQIEVIEAGHPVPDEAGLKAAERTLQLARTATANDLVLVLISGGGSANWFAPVDDVGFAQKQAINRALLRSGAPIGDINTVRKHLSRIKGGRLARAAYPAQVVTLAISDVPHDDPAVIASGPTVPDPSTLADARAVIAKYKLTPDAEIMQALSEPQNESCKPGDAELSTTSFTIIARPRDALDAAVKTARDAGYEVLDLGADVEGEARDVAAAHAALTLRAKREGKKLAIISGGELTVTVTGQGRGGPNQEYALGLLSALGNADGISALAADTDGADGGAGSASDPAGAMIDARTYATMRERGLDPEAFLRNNDATGFFEQTGDLVHTGPTMTNVNDVRVILAG